MHIIYSTQLLKSTQVLSFSIFNEALSGSLNLREPEQMVKTALYGVLKSVPCWKDQQIALRWLRLHRRCREFEPLITRHQPKIFLAVPASGEPVIYRLFPCRYCRRADLHGRGLGRRGWSIIPMDHYQCFGTFSGTHVPIVSRMFAVFPMSNRLVSRQICGHLA